jgi:CheY-like chemotaxis protein
MLNTLMLVDDSDVDLLFTSVIVLRAGIAARGVQFNDAARALDHLRFGGGLSVDAILLDRHMPLMDGFDFLDAYEDLLRSGQAHAPVTLLTASSDPEDTRRALSYRCVRGVLAKPLDIKSALGLAARVSLGSRTLVPPLSASPSRGFAGLGRAPQ